MRQEEIIELTTKYVMNTYSRLPVVIIRGEGCRLWDAEGNEYLDFVSGLGVCNVGHCHPKIVQAVREQVEKLIHVSNLYHIDTQALLAKILVEHSFAEKAFFCNSGAEANEAAMKLARKFSRENSEKERYEIITMMNSFHGRTIATITATGQEKIQKGFAPLLDGFVYIPFNDAGALKKAITERTCAIMIEPIQGEGGINVPCDDYLHSVRDICNENDLLLIFDEVQVGMGRTGKLFAYETFNVEPDIMTLAKGLAGGIPIGVMLAKDKVAQSFSPGTHASTFGGNPIATASGIAALEILTEGEVLENCIKMGDALFTCLTALKERYGFIKEVRGKGLLIGIELDFPCQEIVKMCLAQGLIVNCTMDKVVRLLPPLVVTREEIDKAVQVLDGVFRKM